METFPMSSSSSSRWVDFRSDMPDPDRESPQRVCVIFQTMSRLALYVVELETPPSSYSHSQSDEIVDLDHPYDHGFVDKVPDILLEGFKCPCFFAIDVSVFVFDGRKVPWGGRRSCGYSSYPIYRFEAAEILEFKERGCSSIHIRELGAVGHLFSKVAPQTIRYGLSILVFSTNIRYASETPGPAVDFELYSPVPWSGIRSSIPLPPLRVIRRQLSGSGCNFYLLHPTSEEERLTAAWQKENVWQQQKENAQCCPCMRGDRGDCCDSSFSIGSYSLLHEHIFVVETKVSGLSFYLDLRTCDGWQVFSGTYFPHPHQNFVTANDLILTPIGASIFSRMSTYSPYPTVEFPLSSYVCDPRKRFMELVEDTKYAFVVQVGFDHAERPHWTLDMLSLDVSNLHSYLMKKEKEKEEKNKTTCGRSMRMEVDKECVELIKTYKFLSDDSHYSFVPICLFPF